MLGMEDVIQKLTYKFIVECFFIACTYDALWGVEVVVIMVERR